MAISSEAFKKAYDRLNPQQKQVVDAVDGPVLVVAGPGSGKTEILSLRVANILLRTDTRASNVLCMTFTDAAAANMRRRLTGLIGREAYHVAIYTFHSFCVDIINRYPEYFYSGASFMPADEGVQIEIMEDIFHGLDHENPLRKIHPEQGYTFLPHARRAIVQLKKAGLTPDEFVAVVEHNARQIETFNSQVEAVFAPRMTMKQVPTAQAFLKQLDAAVAEDFPVADYQPLTTMLARSLARALEQCEQQEKVQALSAWKEEYTKKDENGRRVLKEAVYTKKLLALAEIYRDYTTRMHERGYYDFEDMLVDVLQALRSHPQLRYELQEQFHYILIDEFQDTNDAQMRLLRFLTDAAVHEGRPNIMAVGDDDQAIYKFQGAEISNILSFNTIYRDPAVITLVHNYRSRQEILDLARHIIVKGENRLENLIPQLQKELIASNGNLPEARIISRKFLTSIHEYNWVAQEVQRLLKEGREPSEIAVIGRQHRNLEGLAPYLHARSIPINYERQRNVFLEPHIHQLILMARFIVSLSQKKMSEADDLLPEILSFPFWGLQRQVVWSLSVQADRGGRLPWIQAMLESDNRQLGVIANFFLGLSQHAQYEPLEHILDMMIGSHISLLPDVEEEDEQQRPRAAASGDFVSPFRDYYFGREQFEHNRAAYLDFLSSLRVFIQALRQHKQGQLLKLADLVSFVDTYEKNHLVVTDQSPFVNAANAVNVLTAHKAKGLEFETVFVLSCQDDIWAGDARGSMLPFPHNLPIAPAGDTLDDQLRLFYVAITRTKHELYLTSYETLESGKESLRLRFLIPSQEDGDQLKPHLKAALDHGTSSGETSVDLSSTRNVLATSWESYAATPFVPDEKALLQEFLKDYQMSVTHLNNFLNVADGGPRRFLEQNLLRFPQAKTPSGAYGSAMHKTLELCYAILRKDGRLPPMEDVIAWFRRYLERERLSDKDLEAYARRGAKALQAYYEQKKNAFKAEDKIEMDFKHQGVVVEDVPLAGKIDKLSFIDGKTLRVYDFKTGTPSESWEGVGLFETVKLHNYRRQLVFYKLLVEHSRDFGGTYKVHQGVLEFLEPARDRIVDLTLEIDDAEAKRIKQLIVAVHKKIISLDFPDVSGYPGDLKGIKAFEDDLLADRK